MSASDQRRQQQTGEATGTRSAGADWRRMAAFAPWLILSVALFAVATRLELFERLYEATRTYEEWQLDELLSLLLSAGIVALVMLAFRTRQLSREIARREAAERLAHDSARHDPLTGLANSRRFREEIKSTIGNAEKFSSGCGVIYIDLDGFKPVNDTHGHAVGDGVLVEVARRITQAAPKGATVARLGGDEFGVVVSGVGNPEALLFLSQRLQRDIAKPIEIGLLQLTVGATVGIAVFPDDGSDAEALIASADRAMYIAKRARSDGFGRDGAARASVAS
ncbi:diguanylate cyclase (GGDEF)-like protein [Aminobacter niigataensis]|uniref:Diguanylate cyclase (GGDEF)-like protein n=1 Tax=Aminobacter niigataensis TaxID=83265 RepID=A0ABR6L0B6_9HYPH|nr:GGDEF domain-containing protein [Aminobacter niigataensis]MBB4650225.1 diguanylate cyclase (GGDEF)-like protein [Aminobacter niigataensis]